jgi:ribonuclease HI
MTEKYTINCDGNKPTEDGFVIHKQSQPMPACLTSNEAEYDALLLAMSWCEEGKYDTCRFLSDSKLVVCGVNNPKVHSGKLLAKKQQAVKGYLTRNPNWIVEWVPREDNSAVDSLTRMNPTGSVETFKQ